MNKDLTLTMNVRPAIEDELHLLSSLDWANLWGIVSQLDQNLSKRGCLLKKLAKFARQKAVSWTELYLFSLVESPFIKSIEAGLKTPLAYQVNYAQIDNRLG